MKEGHKRLQWIQSLLDWSHRAAYWLILAGSIGFIAAVGYLGYGLFSGALAGYPQLSDADQNRSCQNVLMATRLLHYSALGAAIGALLWRPGRFESGYGTAALGFLLNFGFPIFMHQQVGMALVGNRVLYILAYCPTQTGRALLIIGLVACVCDGIQRFRDAVRESRKRRAARTAKMGITDDELVEDSPLKSFRFALFPRPCWELPVCKSYMRKVCELYAKRCCCWRKKTGCLCNDEFLLMALQGAKDYKKSDLKWLVGEKEMKSSTGVKADCKACPVFNLHQKEKYRILGNLALPAGILVAFLLADKVHEYYQASLMALATAISQISFAPGVEAHQTADYVIQSLQSSVMEWLLVIALALWAANLFHRVVETIVLKLKW